MEIKSPKKIPGVFKGYISRLRFPSCAASSAAGASGWWLWLVDIYISVDLDV